MIVSYTLAVNFELFSIPSAAAWQGEEDIHIYWQEQILLKVKWQ